MCICLPHTPYNIEWKVWRPPCWTMSDVSTLVIRCGLNKAELLACSKGSQIMVRDPSETALLDSALPRILNQGRSFTSYMLLFVTGLIR